MLQLVLILIIMEDTLRVYLQRSRKERICWVLILIILEDTL